MEEGGETSLSSTHTRRGSSRIFRSGDVSFSGEEEKKRLFPPLF